MKRILSVLFLFAAIQSFGQLKSYPTFVQPNYSPAPNCVTGNMLNIANSYSYLNVSNFLSNFLDTPATGTTTTYLYPAYSGSLATPVVKPWSAVDTFVPYPIFGPGTFGFVINGLKISGTPAGNVTVEESTDGYTWAPVRTSETKIISSVNTGTVTAYNNIISPDTFVIANVAGTQAYSYNEPYNFTPYKRIKVNTSGTQQSSWGAKYFFIKQPAIVVAK